MFVTTFVVFGFTFAVSAHFTNSKIRQTNCKTNRLKKKTKNSSNTYATVYSEKPCWFSNPYSKLMFAKTQCECKKRRIVLMTAKHSATVYSCDRPQQFIEIRKQCHKTLRTPNCVQKCCRRNFSSKTSELRTNDWLNVYAEPCRIVNHCETTAVTRAVLCQKGLAM